jgi:hypothetical protein
VEQELGSRLPEGVEVRVVEESADTIYLVLPFTPAVGKGGELSDQELGEVAGGGGTFYSCSGVPLTCAFPCGP